MLLSSTFTAALVGLTSATFFFKRDNNSDFLTLSQAKIDKFSPYSHYAAAVKCSPQSVAGWNCGGMYLTCDPFPFLPAEGRGGVPVPDEPVLTRGFPANCVANPTFQILMNGGDGSDEQVCTHIHQAVNSPFLVVCMLMLSTGFVGYDQYLDTVIVAHQGTDKKRL